jgi:hypothetical protein
MARGWQPLANMREVLAPEVSSYKKLVGRLHNEGFQIIDLVQIFGGRQGTYLNMDGHWSGDGNRLVADFLAPYIKTPPPRIRHAQ